jgi:hypothetical protein
MSNDKKTPEEDPNYIFATTMKKMAKERLKDFFDFFRKSETEKYDWSKGYAFDDEALKRYVTPGDLALDDRFYLFVEMTRADGSPIRMIINTIFDLKTFQVKVGIAEIPDLSYLDEDDEDDEYDEDDDDEDDEMQQLKALELFSKNFKAALKSGDLKPVDNSPNCSRCGRSDLPLTITLEAMTMKTDKICPVCMREGGPDNVPPAPQSIKELDEDIAEYEKMTADLERMIKEFPEPENVNRSLPHFGMTPLSAYRSAQAILAELKYKRVVAMTSMGEATRLEYELEKALQVEDYEKSAELQKKLNEIRKED